jgi:WASH complex subunit strumpellin
MISNSSSVLRLRAVFKKLGTILESTCFRISQSGSPDLISVSNFYSEELVDFGKLVMTCHDDIIGRTVLEIVPRTMFQVLSKIIDIQTNRLKEMPIKIDREQLLKFSQLEERNRLAKLTHSVSVLTEGILSMETTEMGVIQVDSKNMLEEGVRKELVRQISLTLDTFSNPKPTVDDFDTKIHILHGLLDGIKRSIQYIQDYMSLYGLKLWQEEFSRITNYYVECECAALLGKQNYQSVYQSVDIPIPRFQPTDDVSRNWMGRLGRSLVSLTHCQKTVYLSTMTGWFDVTGREVVGRNTFYNLTETYDWLFLD